MFYSRKIYRTLAVILACVSALAIPRIGRASTLTILHSFGSEPGPRAGLIEATDGNFYGTTLLGGANRQGSIFSISSSGDFQTIYSFTGGTDGGQPSGLIQASDGNLYCTSQGSPSAKFGTIFKITLGGAFTTIHTFTGSVADGASARRALIQGIDGYLYGVGASPDGTLNFREFALAEIFKVATDGSGLTVLNILSGPPLSSLIQASDGNFYGTRYGLGETDSGGVFQMTPDGTLKWLWQAVFGTGTLGYKFPGPLLQASNGNFYGVAGPVGIAVLFEITAGGQRRIDGTNGYPATGLIQGSDGNLYGGSLIEVGLDGTGYTHLFSSGLHGSATWAPTQSSDGSFYGTDTVEIWKFTK